jgi:hypothetical protein
VVQTKILLPKQLAMAQIKVSPCLVGESRHLTVGSKEQAFITEEANALLTSEQSKRKRNFNLDSFLFSVPFNALTHIRTS